MTTLYVRDGAEFREATREEILSHSTGTENSQGFHLRHLLVGTYGDLRIGGRWFELAGFSVGARVSVRVSRKRLIIEVAQEPPQAPHREYRRPARPAPLF